MEIQYSRNFIKEFRKCPENIKNSFKIRLSVFIQDEHSPILKNHILIGKFKGYSSINITGDWRAIFKAAENNELIIFTDIGTHSKLYS